MGGSLGNDVDSVLHGRSLEPHSVGKEKELERVKSGVLQGSVKIVYRRQSLDIVCNAKI